MGSDIFYHGRQLDSSMQENLIDFLSVYFQPDGFVKVTESLYLKPCIVAHIWDADIFLTTPENKSILLKETISSASKKFIQVEKHPALPYFGIIPWTMEQLCNNHESDIWQRLHFVFHRPTGHLCRIAMREWFNSLEEWRYFLENELGFNNALSTFSINSDILSKIVCVSNTIGYWRTLYPTTILKLLHYIKQRFMPGIWVGDDCNIWQTIFERKNSNFLNDALK
jgi:hypothetical protein